MYIIGIDPGRDNIGVAVIDSEPKLYALDLVSRSNNHKEFARWFYQQYKSYLLADTIVVIEQQPRYSSNTNIFGFLSGFLFALGVECKQVKPWGYNQGYTSYKDRKQASYDHVMTYSERNQFALLKELDVSFDQADALNIALKYIKY